MKTLIKLINDIKTYKLEINNIKFNNYDIAVEKHFKKDNDLIVNKIVFEQYDSTKFFDWDRVSNQHIKEGWSTQNYDLENCFEFFLDLIKKLTEEKGLTEEKITNKLDLITFNKKGISFQYSHYDNWETINFYLEGQTSLGLDWERIKNSESILNLINWLIMGY